MEDALGASIMDEDAATAAHVQISFILEPCLKVLISSCPETCYFHRDRYALRLGSSCFHRRFRPFPRCSLALSGSGTGALHHLNPKPEAECLSRKASSVAQLASNCKTLLWVHLMKKTFPDFTVDLHLWAFWICHPCVFNSGRNPQSDFIWYKNGAPLNWCV